MDLSDGTFTSWQFIRHTRWLMMSRNPLAHLLFHFRIVRITREVMPFPLVFLVIIQLLGPISINDVSVSFGSPAV